MIIRRRNRYIKRIESSRERDRFDGKIDFHAHFHCEFCGGLFDLPFAPESLMEELKTKTGHHITGQHIDFFGSCFRCVPESQ